MALVSLNHLRLEIFSSIQDHKHSNSLPSLSNYPSRLPLSSAAAALIQIVTPAAAAIFAIINNSDSSATTAPLSFRSLSAPRCLSCCGAVARRRPGKWIIIVGQEPRAVAHWPLQLQLMHTWFASGPVHLSERPSFLRNRTCLLSFWWVVCERIWKLDLLWREAGAFPKNAIWRECMFEAFPAVCWVWSVI